MLKHFLHTLNHAWLRYEYKHTTLAILTILLFVALLNTAIVAALLDVVRSLGYVGAFITGILSVSFFTLAPALVLLVEMAPHLDPFAMAIVAGAGAMIGDWVIISFFRERVFDELKPLFRRLHTKHLATALQHKYARSVLFVAGAVFIATPLPDELGLALLGISHLKAIYVLVVCFVLNTLGLWALIWAARTLGA